MKKDKLLLLEIDEKANKFRREKGYGATDPINLISFLFKNNVVTLFKPLSGTLSGMAIKAPEDLLFIMINDNHSLGKQHFTIGHEIYHLFIQENFTSQRCITGLFSKQSEPEEVKADLFSACFLLPSLGVIELIPHEERKKINLISADTILRIQRNYSVSFTAVIYRLIELDFIDNTYFDLYNTGKAALANRLGYGIDLFKPGNKGRVVGDYAAIANDLFTTNKISESYYLELMNTIDLDPYAPIESDNE
jgi:Zn-dependent peptidase ImmA (M78 family)